MLLHFGWPRTLVLMNLSGSAVADGSRPEPKSVTLCTIELLAVETAKPPAVKSFQSRRFSINSMLLIEAAALPPPAALEVSTPNAIPLMPGVLLLTK